MSIYSLIQNGVKNVFKIIRLQDKYYVAPALNVHCKSIK